MKAGIPIVSIGMPAYNSERWIRAALDSLLDQTFGDFEIIIADNCSTDGTYAICREYAARDDRVRVVRNERNVGAPENFNVVYRLARGRYFKWASTNDVCKPDLLEKCVSILESRPDVVLCYGKTRLIDERGDLIVEYEDGLHLVDDDPVDRYESYLHRVKLNNVEQGLIRTDALAKTKLQRAFQSSDVVLMSELALRGKFFEYPEHLFSRRMAREASTKFATDQENAEFHQPGSTTMHLQGWSQIVAHAGSIFRAPLPWRQKLRMTRYVAKMVLWYLNHLVSGIGRNIKGRLTLPTNS